MLTDAHLLPNGKKNGEPRLLQRLCLKGTTKVIDGVTWHRVRTESGKKKTPGGTAELSTTKSESSQTKPSHVKTTKSPSFASDVPFLALQKNGNQPIMWKANAKTSTADL
jgi:hypothetical protein